MRGRRHGAGDDHRARLDEGRARRDRGAADIALNLGSNLIGSALTRVARQLRQRFDDRVEEMGLTRARWTLIASVAQNEGATQRLIATSLGVTEVTAGRLIDRVCADGYLERRENPQDRRAYCLYLTPAAQSLIEEMVAIAKTFEEEIFGTLSDEDLRKLESILQELSRNLVTAGKSHALRASRTDEPTVK